MAHMHQVMELSMVSACFRSFRKEYFGSGHRVSSEEKIRAHQRWTHHQSESINVLTHLHHIHHILYLATDPRSKLPQFLCRFFLAGGTLHSRFELGGALTWTIAAIGAALHVHEEASRV